jgi:SAM-dependent methyltransferase
MIIRSRGLDIMESRFGKSKPIERFIKKRQKSEKVVRVLEFGFGEGKCLLDLRITFPDKRVQLYGVNKKRRLEMTNRNDFVNIANKYNIFIPKRALLPKPFFYDVEKGLHFKSNYFDLIISQLAFPYVGDKAKLLEELWRVLKPQGKAFLNIDSYETYYPDFLQINKETPRFIIYKDDKFIKLSRHLNQFKKKGYNIRFKKRKDRALRFILMEKNITKNLNLELKYDIKSSLNLFKFNKKKNSLIVLWGIRSVFKVKDDYK